MSSVLTFQFVPIDDSGEVDQLKWQAISFYESEPDAVCYWEIYCNRHGLFTVDCSDYQMVDGCGVDNDRFDNLQSAKSFCEHLENSLQQGFERDDHDLRPLLAKREQRNKGLIPA
jgi:hypothetical protein